MRSNAILSIFFLMSTMYNTVCKATNDQNLSLSFFAQQIMLGDNFPLYTEKQLKLLEDKRVPKFIQRISDAIKENDVNTMRGMLNHLTQSRNSKKFFDIDEFRFRFNCVTSPGLVCQENLATFEDNEAYSLYRIWEKYEQNRMLKFVEDKLQNQTTIESESDDRDGSFFDDLVES